MNTTIVFDLDDTLYRESEYVRSGIRSVDIWVQWQLGVPGFAATAIRLWNAGRRELLFDATLAELGAPADPSTIAAMVAVYRDHVPRIRLATDARVFLAGDHGFSLALISDGFGKTQRRKAAVLGLPRYPFDPLIFTDDWGRDYWKPHRRAFEAVEAAHRGRSSRFVYVADNPAKDFLAPRALGWATVQIDRPSAVHPRNPPSERHHADTRIRSLRDLTRQRVESLFDPVFMKLRA
ncbi:HAD family hydrolase [Sphingomonas sp. BT-65]|uniref:HAD family hydrolase n=1 Tax=Sphingomonas sp. BT-65 TaxID=2989821 RepID=UPI002235A531|nr:HAD family hydrolase [Sphingomonas sp. BT-65]MCW4463450.1 HAD family hydrolase [Sphingomonas sp. BT-65]